MIALWDPQSAGGGLGSIRIRLISRIFSSARNAHVLYAHTCRELIAHHRLHRVVGGCGVGSSLAPAAGTIRSLWSHTIFSSRGRQRQSESGNRASSTPREPSLVQFGQGRAHGAHPSGGDGTTSELPHHLPLPLRLTPVPALVPGGRHVTA